MNGPCISSLQNERIKELLRLRRRSGRGDEILIDGVREIQRAAHAGLGLTEIYYCPEFMGAAGPAPVLASLGAAGVRAIETARAVHEKLRYGDRTGGVVAVAPRPHRTLEGLPLSASPLVAVLDEIEKPGNLGAILRTADAAGVEAVLVISPRFDIYGPNVIRASVSAVFSVPVIELAREAAQAWIRARGLGVLAAGPEASKSYTEIDFCLPWAMVFGSESGGLSPEWRGPEAGHVRIPMQGMGDSLNVATTAAVLFFEARRQRGPASRL